MREDEIYPDGLEGGEQEEAADDTPEGRFAAAVGQWKETGRAEMDGYTLHTVTDFEMLASRLEIDFDPDEMGLNAPSPALTADVAEKLAALAGEKAALSGQVAELTSRVTTLTGEVTTLQKEKADLATDIESAQTAKKAAEKAASEAVGQVTALQGEVANLKEALAKEKAKKQVPLPSPVSEEETPPPQAE
jgi:regulator of replication initiation timing